MTSQTRFLCANFVAIPKAIIMRKALLTFLLIPIFGVLLQAQSIGFLTFKFTQPQPTSPSGNKNVLAVWIENNSGTFIKTRMRFWGNGTSDHLPTWKSISSQNIVDAISGATLKSSTNPTAFGTKTVMWDGKDVSGNIVADGTYTVWIESSWENNLAYNSHNEIIDFSFTKGPNAEHLMPNGDAYINNVSLDWVPSAVSISKPLSEADFSIFPNPTNDKIKVLGNNIQEIRIYNISGKMLLHTIDKDIDMSSFAVGMYLVKIITKNGSFVKKVYKL